MQNRYSLVGKVLSYSYSKMIHEKHFKMNNILSSYDLKEISEANFSSFIKEAKKIYSGFNVTVPYKEKIIPYLDKISEQAKILKSVNTVFIENNKMVGYNTDYFGFRDMMDFYDVDFENQEIIILGTGATSKMITYYAKCEKAKTIQYVSRKKNKEFLKYDDEWKGNILINTIPLCEDRKKEILLIHESQIRTFHTIIDLKYNPFYSDFLKLGIVANKTVINGLYMLVSQAIYAESIWQKQEYNKKTAEDIYQEIKMAKTNIILIGMMGVGKTTIGKKLSQRLKLDFFDSDEIIENEEKLNVYKIFEKYGENYFRKKEKKTIELIIKYNRRIISVGGGACENNDNFKELSKNSIIIFLTRDMDLVFQTISKNKKRPLFNINNYQELYEKRGKKYRLYSDIVIENNLSIDKTIEEIIEKIKKI